MKIKHEREDLHKYEDLPKYCMIAPSEEELFSETGESTACANRS